MNRLWEANCLSEDDLRERMTAFATSNGSLDAAADLGLFALNVPTRFGGLFIDWHMRGEVYRSLRPLLSHELLYAVGSHQHVCDEIYKRGTFTQHDFYLPQLAAGKRIGIHAWLVMDTPWQSSLSTKECDGGFLMTGNTVARGPVSTNALVKFTAMLNGQVRTFIVEGAALPQGRKVKRGWTLYELRRHFIAQHTLLGGLMPVVQPSTEKWEAIRWRTDQSAS